jgi:hypothetical protein
MTREERAVQREQRLKDALAAARRDRAKLEAQQRAAARVVRAKRRQRVGTLADEAGLLEWDDTTLFALFQSLARLHETTDPVAVLEGLLADPVVALTKTPAGAAAFLLTSLQSDSSKVSGEGKGRLLPRAGK